MGFEVLFVAARSLSGNRFRSLLTVLSILTGTFAIVLMTSLAESALGTIEHGIEELGGAKLLLVGTKNPERAEAKAGAYARGFRTVDRDAMTSHVPHVVESAMYTAMGTFDARSDGGTVTRTDLVAADATFPTLFKMELAEGRLFAEDENREHAPVCLVGQKTAKNLWVGSALGHRVDVGEFRCRVVGVLRDKERLGVGFGFDWVELVVAPSESVADSVRDVREDATVVMKTDDSKSNDVAKRIVNARLLEARHGIDDFTLLDFAGFMDRFHAVFAILEAVVGLVAGIALVIGGVGVMNMMLVSVSERVREIGIRKALGASPGAIGTQFIVEAILLTTFGGGLGVGLGALAARGASTAIVRMTPVWQGTVSTSAAVVASIVSVLLGVTFGWLPARRASRLDPVVAMRP
ncbi:MAG: ABC transporter permease [Polyangiaceae bacterium]